MLRFGCIALSAIVAIPLLLLGILGGLVALIVLLAAILGFGGDSDLEYMFEADDPAAIITVAFPTSEVTQRLDASGVRHGDRSFGRGGPPAGYAVMMDNGCKRAWFREETDSSLRIIGLESSNGCWEDREQLVEFFASEFVPRLGGNLPPLPYVAQDGGDFYTYPAGSEPRTLLAGSMQEAQERLDGAPLFEHQVHDDVYYMTTCGGRFKLIERADERIVEVIGIGYTKPCDIAKDECLEPWFSTLLGQPGDPTPTPAPLSVLQTREAADCRASGLPFSEYIKTVGAGRVG